VRIFGKSRLDKKPPLIYEYIFIYSYDR